MKLKFLRLNSKIAQVVRLNGKGVILFRSGLIAEAGLDLNSKYGLAFEETDEAKIYLYIAKDEVTGVKIYSLGNENKNYAMRMNGLNLALQLEGSWHIPYKVLEIEQGTKLIQLDLTNKSKTNNYKSRLTK